MELRRLRLLHELHRLGTIAAVAGSLSYSPSSVSVQLAQLEREAGTSLLRRVGRNVELTPAGQRLAEHADEALAADEAVRAELAAIAEAPRGSLRMTCAQTPALALLPGVLARLAGTAPDLQVDFVQRETPQALDDLRSRAVDLVVGIEYEPLPVPRRADVDRQDLLREDMPLAARPDLFSQLPGDPVRIADCAQLPWATGHLGTGLDALVRNVCNRLGNFEPDVHHRSDDGLILSALIASGRAVGLLPAFVTTVVPGISAHPVRDEALQRTIFTAARATMRRSPAVGAVREALRHSATEAARDHPQLHLL